MLEAAVGAGAQGRILVYKLLKDPEPNLWEMTAVKRTSVHRPFSSTLW